MARRDLRRRWPAVLAVVLGTAAPALAYMGFGDGGQGRIQALTLDGPRVDAAPVPVRIGLRDFGPCPADEDPATLAQPRERDCRFEAQLADHLAGSGRFAAVVREPQAADAVDVVVTPRRSRVAVDRTYLSGSKVVAALTLGVYTLFPLPMQDDAESYELELALSAPDGTNLGSAVVQHRASHTVTSYSSDVEVPQAIADALGPERTEALQPVVCDGPHAPEAAALLLGELARAAAAAPRR